MKLLTDAKKAIETLLWVIKKPDGATPLQKQDIYRACQDIVDDIKEVEK